MVIQKQRRVKVKPALQTDFPQQDIYLLSFVLSLLEECMRILDQANYCLSLLKTPSPLPEAI